METNKLKENADYFRDKLKKLDLNIGQSNSHIIPLIIGNDDDTVEISKAIWEKGVAVVPIRPPTVPKNTARLRFSIMATHSKYDLDQTLNIVGEVVGKRKR